MYKRLKVGVVGIGKRLSQPKPLEPAAYHPGIQIVTQSCLVKRLQARMEASKINQTELARRVGCSPASMARLLQGRTQRSRFLPDIARVLRTSVEYLIGETDDALRPSASRATKALTHDETAALSSFRALSSSDKQIVLRVVECLARSSNKPVRPV